MLDRGVWGNALPPHTCTITSCLLRFLSSVANPSKMGQSHTLLLFLPSFWDDATLWRVAPRLLRGHSVRSTFPLNEPIVTIDFTVGTNGPIVVLFPRIAFDLRDFVSLNHYLFISPIRAYLNLTAHIAPLCPTSHHRTCVKR